MTTPSELRASAQVMKGLPYSPGNRSWLLIDHIEAMSIARQLEAAAEAMERVEKDAARYRWLRDVGNSTWSALKDRPGCSAAQVDAAIDSAMGVGKTGAAGVGGSDA